MRVRQILLNLLSNAVKFTPEGGSVDVTTTQEKSTGDYVYIKLIVADDGIGMEDEFMKRIFKPFEQQNSGTTRKYGGTGLGLSITYNIVKLMGGTIAVKSKVSEGSSFILEIPFLSATDKEEHAEIEIEAQNLQGLPAIDMSGKRVLVAEDNALNCEIMTELLQCLHAEVDCVENGRLAVEKLRESQMGYYDIILMDIMMPVMDGLRATSVIRNSSHPDAKTIPIVAVSANAFAEDVAEALACGMDDHIAKPIEMKELYQILQKYLC